MKAFLKNNRQAPRKVRLIARAIIGKTVPVALSELDYMPHKGAETLLKLVSSAVANAKQADVSVQEENLIVKNITVDKGVTLQRFMPRAFGRASPIHKESSHIHVFLEEIGGKKKKDTASVKVETKKKEVPTKAEEKEKKETKKEVEKKIEETTETKKETTSKDKVTK